MQLILKRTLPPGESLFPLALPCALLVLAFAARETLGYPKLDFVALMMSGLAIFIAAIVLGFSARHLRSDPRKREFRWRVGCLATALVALASAPDLVTFAGAWLVSGQLMVKLVGHDVGSPEARSAALRCRRAYLIGDAALVGAFALLAWHSGGFSIAEASRSAVTLPKPMLLLIGSLLAAAACVRSALWPASGWLLGSMSAPTPVSALMHGGFVNAGGFLLIRFGSVLQGSPALQLMVVGAGISSAIVGICVLMIRPDIKGALGGSTVSQMGFMVMSCGLGAYGAALFHLVAHGLFKAWLFLSAGSTIGLAGPHRRASAALPAIMIALAGALTAALWLAAERSIPAIAPLALAVTTAVMTLFLLGRKGSFVPAAIGLALAAFSTAASLGLSRLVREPFPSHLAILLGPPIVVLTIVIWIAQLRALERGLPPRLYAVLLNCGVLAAR